MPGSEWLIVIVNLVTTTAIIIIIFIIIVIIVLKPNRVFYYLAFKRTEKRLFRIQIVWFF